MSPLDGEANSGAVALYGKVEPPGGPIQINVEPFTINDDMPTDAGVRIVVKSMRNGCAGGALGIKAEHTKQWLHNAVQEEEKSTEVLEKHWQVFVKLI